MTSINGALGSDAFIAQLAAATSRYNAGSDAAAPAATGRIPTPPAMPTRPATLSARPVVSRPTLPIRPAEVEAALNGFMPELRRTLALRRGETPPVEAQQPVTRARMSPPPVTPPPPPVTRERDNLCLPPVRPLCPVPEKIKQVMIAETTTEAIKSAKKTLTEVIAAKKTRMGVLARAITKLKTIAIAFNSLAFGSALLMPIFGFTGIATGPLGFPFIIAMLVAAAASAVFFLIGTGVDFAVGKKAKTLNALDAELKVPQAKVAIISGKKFEEFLNRHSDRADELVASDRFLRLYRVEERVGQQKSLISQLEKVKEQKVNNWVALRTFDPQTKERSLVEIIESAKLSSEIRELEVKRKELLESNKNLDAEAKALHVFLEIPAFAA